MPLKFAIRACCLAGALSLCVSFAAERKPSLIGATRDQVIARFGEPKSNIVAGNREVLFFTGERVVLRDNRVIEAEEVPVEAPPPPVAPTPPSEPATGAGLATPAESTVTASNAHPSGPAATSATSSTSAPVGNAPAESTATATTIAPRPPPAEPEVIIKSIRPPSPPGTFTPLPADEEAGGSASAPASATSKSTSTGAAISMPAPTTSQSSAPTSATAPQGMARPGVADIAAAASTATTTTATTPAATSTVETATASQPNAIPALMPPAATTPAAIPGASSTVVSSQSFEAARKPLSTAQAASLPTGFFTTQSYMIAGVIIVGGLGYLIWRRRQRTLLLAATAVSNPPFAPQPVAVAPGTRFTVDLLNKLEWKRFEELVAAYYNKTGVVASRTKKGPGSPVHIRISWKGEQRPFACVECIPHPAALIDAKPVQALSDALANEDVRRGYIVTSGKFGVPARDLAEEKHITLLSGDLFVEKLNALPEVVRNELMKDVTTGDYMTPSCPTCDTKMTRSPADPSAWQCPQCGTVLPRA